MEQNFFFNIGADVSSFLDGVKTVGKQLKELGGEAKEVGDKLSKSAQKLDLFKRGGIVFEKLNEVTGGLASQVIDLGREGVQAFKALNVGASAFRSALLATGIGVFIVALGIVVDKWDDIKGAVDGVSAELKNQRSEIEKNISLTERSLELINAGTDTLKRQGLTQTDINNLKIQELETLFELRRAEIQNIRISLKGRHKVKKHTRVLSMGRWR